MKQISAIFLLVAVLVFPGCISRRDALDTKPSTDVVMEDTNSHIVKDDREVFSVRLPQALRLTTDLSEKDARLVSVVKEGSSTELKFMFIEETANSISAAADLFANVEGVSVVRRDSITRNGFEGVKVTAVLKNSPGRQVPYYFLSAGGKTYVFSLPAGQPWPYFEAVIDSFTLLN